MRQRDREIMRNIDKKRKREGEREGERERKRLFQRISNSITRQVSDHFEYPEWQFRKQLGLPSLGYTVLSSSRFQFPITFVIIIISLSQAWTNSDFI